MGSAGRARDVLASDARNTKSREEVLPEERERSLRETRDHRCNPKMTSRAHIDRRSRVESEILTRNECRLEKNI